MTYVLQYCYILLPAAIQYKIIYFTCEILANGGRYDEVCVICKTTEILTSIIFQNNVYTDIHTSAVTSRDATHSSSVM